MAELLKCKAIILTETEYNENDKMLTALSDEFGKISVSAKGAKRPNSKFLAASQQFCYSEMQLTQSQNGVYNLCEAELIESFYGLRNDLDYLMAANEISKKILKISQEELSDPELLRLFLNTLYVLSHSERNISLVTSIFDIRAVYDQGYLKMPEKCKNGTLQAINYITGAELKNLFSFDVSCEVLDELKKIGEKSMNAMLQL